MDGDSASCRRLRDIRAGDRVVTGMRGIRVIPESKAVLQSSNKGTPAILDETTDVAQAYIDVVTRFLGQELQHRFIEEEKRSFFGRLFG